MTELAAARHPSWFADGIVLTGNWEPLFFRRRNGIARVGEEDYFAEEHSEATVTKLAAAGVNLIITHFDKGAPLAAHMDEVERTRALAERCHRHGLKLGVYIRYDTLFTELLADDLPQAREWERVAGDGSRPTYPRQPWRKLACPSCDEHQTWIEDKVRLAVQYVRTDLIHFDGFGVGREPLSCQCDRCRRAFQQFLVEKYGKDAQRIKERYGHERLHCIEPPAFHPVGNPFVPANPIDEPGMQDWVEFRCALTARIHRRFAELIRSLDPEVAVEVNGWFQVHQNSYSTFGNDPALYASENDAMWTEDAHWPGLHDGVLVSRVREFKCAEALGNVPFSYIHGEDERQVQLCLAQALAFSHGALGHVGSGLPFAEPFWPLLERWIAFYRRHPRYFQGTRSLAAVAVLRHRPSLAFGGAETYRSLGLAEQTLLQAHIPFDVLFDEHLPERIERYRVIVLPNTTCLSDAAAEVIRRYVEAGGGLVVTEFAGHYDERRRERADTVLRSLVGPQAAPPYRIRTEGIFGYGLRTQVEPVRAGPVRRTVGGGRVAYLAGATYQQPARHGWALPPDWRELAEVVRWAAGSPMALRTNAPDTVLCEPRAAGDGAICVHVVNYDLAARAGAAPFIVEIALPPGRSAGRVWWLDPDGNGGEGVPLQRRTAGGWCGVEVPALDVYGLIVLELLNAETSS